jgi:hypothetical protein
MDAEISGRLQESRSKPGDRIAEDSDGNEMHFLR